MRRCRQFVGSNGILDNPKAPHLQARHAYNFASNYHGAWHPSLPNYVAMITGDFVGIDVAAAGHSYPAGSTVGISDDDSPSVAVDYGPPENIPVSSTNIANWPGDNNTAKLYAVKHNPFPYVAEVQDDPAQFAKQLPFDQLFSDLATRRVPAFSYIVPDQCRDMHGIGNPLAPCGGAADTDDNDVKRGDDEAFWLVNSITGSPVWNHGRNAIFLVFDDGNGPLSCSYNPDTRVDTTPGPLLPGADCYSPKNFNDRLVMIVITNYGVRGVTDNRFYNHYSLLRTLEEAFDLPLLGHAADRSTNSLAPLLRPRDY